MPGIQLIQPNTKFAFMPRRVVFFIFSAFLIATSLVLSMTRGLNFGIDFKGGIMIEVQTPEPADLSDMRATLGSLGLGDVNLQDFGSPNDILIRIQQQDGGDKAQQVAVTAVKEALGNGVKYRRTEFVGPKVSEELFLDGIYAVLAAMSAMLIYIWLRFEWQFGVCAVVALLHDVISTIGIFSLLALEFNLSTVAAVLTIAGYSINDTVVVFDRVRENLRRYKTMPLSELFNQSINETLSRTIMTSSTTLIALIALYTLGGPIIRDFSFAMMWGILIGTYSSICLAVPLLLYMAIERRAGISSSEKETAAERAS
jgi:preprotein translocase subunit SecF